MTSPVVGIIMGSQTDWSTMKKTADILTEFSISFETKIVSAHRTPNRLWEYGNTAVQKGLKVIVAGAGGAAHLPGMMASKTRIPVIGVPINTKSLSGLDSLYSIVQMPKGVAVGTLAIGDAGAANAGLLAAQVIGLQNPEVQQAIKDFRAEQTATILAQEELVLPSL